MSRAAATLGPAVAEFAEGCLLIPEGPHEGKPFVFEDWQREDTDVIYEVDEDGLPLWKIVVYGLARGSGKSPLCAVYTNHALLDGVGSPQVFCAAAARSQAGIVHKYANKEARQGPLEDFLEFPRVGEALGPIKCPANGGILRVVSADGDLQQGLAPAFVAMDELHTFKTSKQVGLYFAMTTALHKREDSRMIIITTAGASKDSLLGELVDAIIAAGDMEVRRQGCKIIVRDYDAKRLLIWYGAPEEADIRDPAIWRACNPASWITDESLRIAAASSPESEFRRYYLNQWVKGEDAAIQPGAWDACRGDTSLPEGAEIWVGVDLGEKRDTSAIVWLAPVAKEAGGEPSLVVRSGIFAATMVSGMETSLPEIEARLRSLRDRYQLRRVNFDPWQMRDTAARLASEGFPMCEFAQNNVNMVPASQLTFDAVATRQIVHDGDMALRAHILGTAGEITSTGGWRFVKAKTRSGNRDLSKNNDGCIALAMALAGWRADNPSGGEPWVDSW